MIKKKLLLIILLIAFPFKAIALIEVDITRGNLSPLPLAVSSLSSSKEDQKKSTKAEVANAWSSYQSSMSVLDSIRSQVKAAEIANEGITLEYES